MIKLLSIGLISIVTVVGASSAEAGDKHYKGGGGYHHGYKNQYYGHGNYHSDIGDEILIGAGIIGGSILLSSLLTRPNYPTAPAYYAPQYSSYCVQDQVYRYMPDGRIQWGTRTRCR